MRGIIPELYSTSFRRRTRLAVPSLNDGIDGGGASTSVLRTCADVRIRAIVHAHMRCAAHTMRIQTLPLCVYSSRCLYHRCVCKKQAIATETYASLAQVVTLGTIATLGSL